MAISIGDNSNYDMIMALSKDKINTSVENTLKQNFEGAEDEKLWGACKEFEKYFLEQMYKAMEKTVEKSDLMEESQTEEYFHDMLTQEYAKLASDRDEVGLAKVLYEQMHRTYV